VSRSTEDATDLEPRPLDLSPGIASPPTRDIRDVRRAFGEIVRGAAALHDAGLRHGDIKPANVLLRTDGRVVLVDFGLVRPVIERGQERTTRGGTPTFMAPEQFGGGEIGPEADLYAIGATLYLVLTGWHPFAAASWVDLYVKKMNLLPPAAHLVAPGVPVDLSEVAAQLMSPDPSQRPRRDALLALFGDGRVPEVGAEARRPRPSPESASERRRLRLVGREAELFALERAYGAARAGSIELVHTHGPSGIGKSALVSSFLSAVNEVDAAVVLRGRCYERESVPYKGFDRILDDLADRLAHMPEAEVAAMLPAWTGELGQAFPSLSAVPAIAARAARARGAFDAMELRRRAFSALGELLLGVRRSAPVVLAIDDLQWIDEDSAHLLEALLLASDPAPKSKSQAGAPAGLLVIALSRPADGPASQALAGFANLCAELGREGRFLDLPLSPLSEAEALDLAQTALRESGAPESERRAARLAEEARGVPFFIEELARFAGENLERGDNVTLDELIRARVDHLPEEQRALAAIVAVAASPLPQSIVFEAAAAVASVPAGRDPGPAAAPLSALLALRAASLVTVLGVGADDLVSSYHDRIRESLVASLEETAKKAHHLAIGRALARRRAESRTWVFDAIRHLRAAADLIDDPRERMEVARLHAEAGERARDAAAFPLAFDCFEAGIALLSESAWEADYELTMRLFQGSTSAAYLTASPAVLAQRIRDVKSHARSVLDELVAWQAEIDGLAGAHQYAAAVDAALEALARLDVHLPRDPSAGDVAAAVERTLARLVAIGPQALLDRPGVSSPLVSAATEVQVRVSPAAYFGKPAMVAIIACNLVTTSIDRGVSPATPYALALFGIVLNTIGQYRVAHEWGTLALSMLDRWPSRRLEAATRHILYNLVCCWMVPLGSVLEPLRRVFDIGCESGDYEYASYAAHGYVHDAMYAGRPLGPLREEAILLGARMRALGQVNAVHVHAPFERLLEALTGRLERPWSLDGDGFDEEAQLAAWRDEGSRSGIFVLSVAMGLARFYFGRTDEASECFERARDYLDAAQSVWHVPILHQFAALTALARWPRADEAERPVLLEKAKKSLTSLEELAALCPENFAHRKLMVEAELARIEGRTDDARRKLDEAARMAQQGHWVNDVALANELAAPLELDEPARARRLRAARLAYSAWGATAKASRLGP